MVITVGGWNTVDHHVITIYALVPLWHPVVAWPLVVAFVMMTVPFCHHPSSIELVRKKAQYGSKSAVQEEEEEKEARTK
jgi:hypothetical protein